MASSSGQQVKDLDAQRGDEARDEESLGADWERQLARVSEMSSAVQQMTPILTNLRKECKALQDRQRSLESDINQRQDHLTQLNEEIEKARNERELLKQTDNSWWNSRPLSASASMTSISEGDVQGKLNRRVWLLDEQVHLLKQEKVNMKREFDDELERERAISSGLRDRISDLEVKRKKLKDDNQAYQTRERELETKVGNLDLEIKEIRDSRNEDIIDMKENMVKGKKESDDLKEEIGRLKEERDNAVAEMMTMREQAVDQVLKSPKILQSQDLNVPSSQLSSQPMTPTKPKSFKPFTPLLTSPSSRIAPPSPTSLARQYAVIEARCNHLQAAYNHQSEAHKLLLTEHNKLRKIHQEDIDHMKKYQASQIERKKKKDERRAQKKARQSQEMREMTGTPGDITSSGKTVGGQDDGPIQIETVHNVVLVEESGSLPHVRKQESKGNDQTMDEEEEYMAYAEQGNDGNPNERMMDIDVPPHMTSGQLVDGINEYQLPRSSLRPAYNTSTQQAGSHEKSNKPNSSHQVLSRYDRSNSSHSAPASRRSGSPPRPPTSQRPRRPNTSSSACTPQQSRRTTATSQFSKRIVRPTHVTPWLGVENAGTFSSNRSRSQSPTKKQRVKQTTNEDDDFASPPDQFTATPTTIRTPLVRDRLGGGSAILCGDSLRKKVMRQTVHDHETPRNATPGPSTGTGTGTRTPTQSSGLMSTEKKRKIIDIETEGLSPSEKALKLKSLAKMPVNEKRELYKGYKGNGRYLRPEEMDKTFGEEYEINPSQNEGNNFAYHDVRRKKAERRNMHGGDCECCKDWYEEIGDIPRFNQAPKWRDDARPHEHGSDRSVSDHVREHQNMVSRHRETWVKPPTPPGYWKIGFPSTQDVRDQNEQADKMIKEKEVRIKKEAL
ncbi:hypothetical protein I203_103387 [Kwoniella mangroviensis CBS 8507]|uniref:uncharacterized protein n=1 Tax=Kwoniella mangroviensis CBS 8507 TaxID=1296122 RepID=UPI00080D6437|nr:uncharacterized protein I203_06094 [Kwoniella mangroviensis CBS 8507]OCF64850.1 hypothetical protein I203_06094 [Kwoniella mangroviensis CBS 8507]